MPVLSSCLQCGSVAHHGITAGARRDASTTPMERGEACQETTPEPGYTSQPSHCAR